jgi:hypothetical protein
LFFSLDFDRSTVIHASYAFSITESPSREKDGPEKIGEATMMTQMGGTVTENSAMAEVGILRVSDFKMVFLASGRGTESLEQLDVPIGKNRPSTTEARDIVRARAGQYALDRALDHLGSACKSGK